MAKVAWQRRGVHSRCSHVYLRQGCMYHSLSMEQEAGLLAVKAIYAIQTSITIVQSHQKLQYTHVHTYLSFALAVVTCTLILQIFPMSQSPVDITQINAREKPR